MQSRMGDARVTIDLAPYRLTGTVYCALLNHRSTLEMLGDAVHQAPYNAPPHSPVLAIKPRNSLTPSGSTVWIPEGVVELEVAANVGLVIGSTACRVRESQALDYVAGYLILADVSVPHANYHRPAVRFRARDGFCPLGSSVAERAAADPDDLIMRTFVDEVLTQSASTADLVRSAARLLADVTEFMTLIPETCSRSGQRHRRRGCARANASRSRFKGCPFSVWKRLS